MNLTKNIVALQRRLIVPPDHGLDNRIMVMTIQAQLMSWGYMLGEAAFMTASKADASWLKIFYQESISYLREVLGGSHDFTPLYKNFPQEVMSSSDSELFWNAIRHYWSNGTWEPSTPQLERPVRFEKISYVTLTPADEEAFQRIFTNLVSLNTSLTPNDMAVVKWFAAHERLIFPENIPFKENLCTLASLGLDVPVTTTTDVLRIAVSMSGGDISLPAVPPARVKANRWSNARSENPKRAAFKFRKFKRSERRYLLGLLEKTHCRPEEMVLKDQRWVRLGEILHPGEYKHQYPKVFAAFNAIRNEKVQSWYGKVETAFRRDPAAGIALVSQRPGEFVRKLDHLLRKYPNYSAPIMAFLGEAVQKTANKALFELYEHFESRHHMTKGRSIMIKGARKKTPLPELTPLPPDVIEAVHRTIFDGLKQKFAKLEPLGNTWIDEKLKNIPLPKNMRSMNFSTKPTVRGARLPFDNPGAKVIRPYIHWLDKHGSEDLDLSVTFIGDTSNHRPVLAYHNLRMPYAVHSGDIRHRQGPCAEYIDIEIAKAEQHGISHAIIDVRNFTGRGLDSVTATFGIMEREHPEANRHWLPETVTSAHSLKSGSPTSIIAVLDLAKKEYVMIDLDTASIPVAAASVADTLRAVQDFLQPPKLSVYDLLLMHAEARGRVVSLDIPVDTYFKFEDFISSYDKTASFMV